MDGLNSKQISFGVCMQLSSTAFSPCASTTMFFYFF